MATRTFTLLNEVLSITAQESGRGGESQSLLLLLNEVLSITAQEFASISFFVSKLSFLNEVLSITAQEWPHSNSAYRLAQSRGLRELAIVTHLNNHHLRCKHI